MADEPYDLGAALEESLREVAAWKRGEVEVDMVEVDPMPAKRIKAIRKKVAKSAKAFERRFGISAKTMENWEQGRRKPDPTARLLLKVIEQDPDAVERAANAA